MTLEDAFVRYRCDIGFLVDARVLRDPDPEGPDDMLTEIVAPAHPDDQPGRYSRHAEVFANNTIPAGDELASLPRPDGDKVTVISADDVWAEGEFIREDLDPEGYEYAEFGRRLSDLIAEMLPDEKRTMRRCPECARFIGRDVQQPSGVSCKACGATISADVLEANGWEWWQWDDEDPDDWGRWERSVSSNNEDDPT